MTNIQGPNVFPPGGAPQQLGHLVNTFKLKRNSAAEAPGQHCCDFSGEVPPRSSENIKDLTVGKDLEDSHMGLGTERQVNVINLTF